MSKPYNGHPSWTAWNVSLWLNNDEDLYRLVRDLKGRYGTQGAARRLLATELPRATPDGAVYSHSNLVHAIRGME